MASLKTISLAEVDAWFDKEVQLKRTAAKGLSVNRIWKAPRDWAGNRPDPNGLCGDTAAFVADEYVRRFTATKDGFQIGMILWDGTVTNHIANVMLINAKTFKQSYVMLGQQLCRIMVDPRTDTRGNRNFREGYDRGALFPLHVYDLYYKERLTVGTWWEKRDGAFGGSVTLALYSDM